MDNGPAVPPIPAGVQTPVVGPCDVSEVPLVLVVKGQAVNRQVTGTGIGPERKRTARCQEQRGQVRGARAGLDQQSWSW